MAVKKLDDVEYEVLDVLYFVESYEKILEEVNYPPNIVTDVLKMLIRRRLVVAMDWNEDKKEYVKSFMYDSDHMDTFHYLATKEGLMAHTSR